jgi:mediator of RNA polymerase II transcription subunit 24
VSFSVRAGSEHSAPLPYHIADRSMNSSLSASQLHTVNMRDPLNRVLGESFPLLLSTTEREGTPS